jgi:hypothetical protein
MNLGTYADVQVLRTALGDDEFRRTLHEARAGEFSARSWHYWHLVLDVSKPHAVPALPTRKFA